MYSDTEILTIAKNCTTTDEVMKAAGLFRMLIRTGGQPADRFLTYVFIKRFREVIDASGCSL